MLTGPASFRFRRAREWMVACALGCSLALGGTPARAQVDHLEFAPIASPQHQANWAIFSAQPWIPVRITAKNAQSGVVPINGDVALTAVVEGIADYTFLFEDLSGWTRLNTVSSYGTPWFDVNGDGQYSPALDLRLNAGTYYGVSRQVFLRGGVPYRFSIDSAVNSDQEVFYGGPAWRWTLNVGTNVVGLTRIGVGYLYPIDVLRLNVAGNYTPPSNGLYTVSFAVEVPFASIPVHVYADDFRIGYPGLTPAVVQLQNGTAVASLRCELPVTNLVLRGTDFLGNTSESNPFTVEPSANLQLYTEIEGTPRAGNDFRYSCVVASLGPSPATGVVLTNILPAGLTLVSAVAFQGVWTNDQGILRCEFGTPPYAGGPGFAPVSLEITARAATPGSYTNQSSVGAREYDLDETNGLEFTKRFYRITLRP